MKYQQLKHLEANWKWMYLIKKHREGENITRYLEKSLQDTVVLQLLESQNNPEKIYQWIAQHLSPDLVVKLDQAIRARRKRYFNAEHQHSRKKSIDLEYRVWQRLSKYAKSMDMTLSEAIAHMIDDSEAKTLYENQIATIKAELKDLIKPHRTQQ